MRDGSGGVPADLAAAIALGGEMGRRFAAHDWAAHPLGPLDGWPPEYRAITAVALTSRFPMVLWLDPEGLYLIYNDGYVPMLGERHPAALGAPGKEVWWDIWDSIGPMLGGVIATGEATWSDDLFLPITAGGRPQERYFTFSYGPIITASGRVGGISCSVNETTARVLGARRLNVLSTAAGELMEARTVDDVVARTIRVCGDQPADLPFAAVYVDGALRGCTPAASGLLPERMADLGAGLVPAPAHPTSDGWPDQALALPLGETGALVLGLNPRQPLDEQYRGFCGLLANQVSAALTTTGSYERERQRGDALAELDRAKTAFLTNVSHEFRTPLTLVLGPVEDAIAAARDQPEQVERLESVHRNAQRLLRLVDSLLAFSRVESGQARPEPTPVDLGALTEQIASSFAELCARAGIELLVDCAPVAAEVDVAMWETVVLNLLSNAVKYTTAGTIRVEVAAAEDGWVSVRVADTGIGIAAKDVGRLFERFYRADNTRGRSVEGTGIGLSLVRSLVELHGGAIGVASEVDVGTVVTVRLPAAKGVGSAPRVQPTGGAFVAEAAQWVGGDLPAEAAGRALVLIVDDNADMRRHLQRILSAHWDTLVAADGEEALATARAERPDLVVTDVMMPGMDGFGFAAAVRADPELAATPLLMLSARAGVESAGDGLASGADDYLPKPFSSQDLVNRVAARLIAASRDRARHEERGRALAALAEFDTALAEARTPAAVLAALLAAPEVCGLATAAAIGVLEPDRGKVRLTYAGAVPAEFRDRYHLVAQDAPLPICDAIRTGRPMTIPDTGDLGERYRQVVADSVGSIGAAAVYPLRDVAGAVVGGLALFWREPRAFPVAERAHLQRTATAVGSAVARVLVAQHEHRIATDFQEQLLDLDRRSRAAVVSAVYQSAGEAMRVGGDWYLVAPLDDPARVGISVGDVVGHGLPAATVMSKLRSAVTAAALTTDDPAAVVRFADRYAASVPGAGCATVAYAAVDSDARTLRYACAGHPYPLLVTPQGAQYLERGRRQPLAARSFSASSPAGHVELPSDSLVVLYTDGLIERPGESLDTGFTRLVDAAAECAHLPAHAVCSALLSRLAPPGGYNDDVVVLALRPTGTGAASFVEAIPAAADRLPDLRHRLRTWLVDVGIDEARSLDVEIACGEALSNAVEHGSGSDPAKTVTVEAFAGERAISVTISDQGRWTADSSASHRRNKRGRGLTLINGLCDGVETERTTRGTHVTLRLDRTRP